MHLHYRGCLAARPPEQSAPVDQHHNSLCVSRITASIITLQRGAGQAIEILSLSCLIRADEDRPRPLLARHLREVVVDGAGGQMCRDSCRTETDGLLDQTRTTRLSFAFSRQCVRHGHSRSIQPLHCIV